MGVWEIILIVLSVINVLAFLSAVWAAYLDWKREGHWTWNYPLMGLFFIPLCILIAFAWPVRKLMDYRKEQKRSRQYEESKKYHLQQFGFRLKGLPFKPSLSEVIYVENGFSERLNDMIRRNQNFIQDCFDKSEYFQSHFIYLPNLITQISHEEQSINYFAPYKKEINLPDNLILNNFSLLDYLLVPENRNKIPSCFARYRGEENDYSVYECVGFEPEENIDEKDFFCALCSTFNHYPMAPGPMYQKKNPENKIGADDNFEKESQLLISEVEERILKLRKLGVSQWVLEQLVKPELKLSKMVLTKDCRIILSDYNNMEIEMEPLVKAVYLLFLNHPEGILFKHLPDYREELTGIYVKLKPLGLTDRAIQSIEDVTNPLLNSINEKCARIRGAFVGQFDDHLARHYYIDGKRGEAKKISLPRDLVVWE